MQSRDTCPFKDAPFPLNGEVRGRFSACERAVFCHVGKDACNLLGVCQSRSAFANPGMRRPLHLWITAYCGGCAFEGGVGLPSIVSGSMISILVPSGSKRLACRLRLIPTC